MLETNKDGHISFAMSMEEFEEYRDEYNGFCLACGADHDSCEADAVAYECYECGKFKVYGMNCLLLMGRIEIRD